jgi:protein O-GlcNAc transferase
MGLLERLRSAAHNLQGHKTTDRPEDSRQLDDLLTGYRRALETNPHDVEAHTNLGNELKNLGRLDAAVASYRSALEINPDFAIAHYNLAVVLCELGKSDDAIAHYRRALEIQPEFAEAHGNLGNILKDLGQLEDAVTSYRRALEIRPSFAEAHYNLGNALNDLGRPADAAASYGRALEFRPDFAEAHSNLGNALRDLGRLDDAVLSYWRALEINDHYPEAHFNLGSALQNLGQFDAAGASYRRALEIKPDFGKAQSNLLFMHNYLPAQDSESLLAEARRFGELAARHARPSTTWLNTPGDDRCLRVGLVSGDLRDHPVGYFAEGVLASLSQEASGRLQLFAYPTHLCADAVAEKIKASCCGWRSIVGVSDESAVQYIREDDIDILMDLSGHTAHNRLPLFAWKPAPVQVSWLGYFATTGVAAIDYLIADPWTLPESEEANFTEKIWRLPETRLCFTPPNADLEVTALSALSNGYVTFGSFNHLSKMNDDVVGLWTRVLEAVPDSRLLLITKQFTEVSVRQRVIERFAAHGIDTGRLMVEGPVSRRQYLAAYQRVDIALDPFPYPGGTTTVDALWMGVPVLTLAGDRFLSRQGVGLLMNVGLPQWVAISPEDYVDRAASHAKNLNELVDLRNGLRKQALGSPIFDTRRFARHFEVALREMWQRWCRKQSFAALE